MNIAKPNRKHVTWVGISEIKRFWSLSGVGKCQHYDIPHKKFSSFTFKTGPPFFFLILPRSVLIRVEFKMLSKCIPFPYGLIPFFLNSSNVLI